MSLTKGHNRMIAGASVNVLDFGAVGDGVTDDTVAIQAAIDSGATDVVVPSGTFRLLAGLTMTNPNVTLRGSGTLRMLSGAPIGGDMILITADGCTVRDLTLDGAGIGAGRTVTATGTTGTTLRNLTGVAAGQMFLRADGFVKDLLVEGCVLNSQGFGVLVQDPAVGSQGVQVLNNRFVHPASGQGDGIEINCPTNGISDVLISGNYIEGSYGTALVAGIGIGLAKIHNATITGNVVINTQGDGIHIEDDSTNVTISGNSVFGCCTDTATTTGGISVATGCKGVSIVGNTVKDTVTRAAFATFASVGDFNEDLSIVGNVFDGAPNFLISFESVKDCIFTNNILTNGNVSNTASTPSIRVTKFSANVCSGLFIKDNLLKDGANATRSIAIAPGSVTTGDVSQNDFSGCGTPAPDMGGTTLLTQRTNRFNTSAAMQGVITLTAATTTKTIFNGNVDLIGNILVYPTNAAAIALGPVYVSSIARQVQFAITYPSAAGGETYAYIIV